MKMKLKNILKLSLFFILGVHINNLIKLSFDKNLEYDYICKF